VHPSLGAVFSPTKEPCQPAVRDARPRYRTGPFCSPFVLQQGLLSREPRMFSRADLRVRDERGLSMVCVFVLQGITIGAMMTSLVVMERQKALGIIPKYRDGSS